MRRGTASLIIAFSLMVASFSWAGFVLSNTVLDPGRSERLATQLLDNPEVREALIGRVADGLETQIPPEVPVPRAVLESGAAIALDDPRVEALIVDGFVRVHQNALAGRAEPVFIDAGALGQAGRDALVATRPELGTVLPPVPAMTVELPTTGLSWLGTVKRLVDRFTRIGALIAVAGLTTAYAVAKDRGSVFRRTAIWGYGASAFWIALGYGIPRVAEALSPRSAAIASAVVDVYFGSMIGPAITMAIIATVLLVIGILWPVLVSRRAARVMQPRNRSSAAATLVQRARGDHSPTAGNPYGGSTSGPGTAPVGAADPTMPLGHLAPTNRPIADRPRTDRPRTDQPLTDQDIIGGDGRSTEWRPGIGYIDDQPNISPFDRSAGPSATGRSRP